jgi:hypothetical protein
LKTTKQETVLGAKAKSAAGWDSTRSPLQIEAWCNFTLKLQIRTHSAVSHLSSSSKNGFKCGYLSGNQYLVELKISNSSHSHEHGGEVGAFYLKINGTSGNSHRIKLQES